MESCIYNGWVRHRRHEPAGHQFRYELFMMYLDLAELPQLFDPHWGWSARGPALARFKRSDYHHTLNDGDDGHDELSLDEAVRRTVTAQTGRRPDGPIRMLSHLRYFGYVFNPVTFYYCFDSAGSKVQTILAEITNTPWKERHAYVLPTSAASSDESVMRFEFGKEFHVSPFWPMDMRYDWRLSTPGEQLRIHMDNLQDKDGATRRVFDATLVLEREQISSAALTRALLKYPLMTTKVAGAIYWQALRLWFRRTPFFTHPKWTATP
ncbi:DUF1365 domain-containing protein [Steroidobacter sp.]|uniref:DUF1365 domain-containing protein n=1 Tax=Steroidobacter sp. TaxID=1978227 RepID=UPI001A3F77A5|nr:DUF1365 domain-containing protein [Steroidobacter sp.]MBL8267325.1 DUF1365 domain-containing protein [Steroidobacter sp.]